MDLWMLAAEESGCGPVNGKSGSKHPKLVQSVISERRPVWENQVPMSFSA